MENLSDRQHQLYEWLLASDQLLISEIQDRFKVSVSTAYRDIRVLVESGIASKTKQGIRIFRGDAVLQNQEKCCFCGGRLHERETFIIKLLDGSSKSACCAHCGLMTLKNPNIQSALTSDFLSGRLINVRQGSYILKSSVSLCCEPSVLSFASEYDASRFQMGFGGLLCNLDQAIIQLNNWMEIN
jgi:DeoR family transcriptional regulator, copper-sensing transcriptional repressor